MAEQHTPGPWKKVATAMWKRDGEPEWNVMEPTSVGRHHYDRHAKEVIQALYDMGYEVKRRRAAITQSTKEKP